MNNHGFPIEIHSFHRYLYVGGLAQTCEMATVLDSWMSLHFQICLVCKFAGSMAISDPTLRLGAWGSVGICARSRLILGRLARGAILKGTYFSPPLLPPPLAPLSPWAPGALAAPPWWGRVAVLCSGPS